MILNLSAPPIHAQCERAIFALPMRCVCACDGGVKQWMPVGFCIYRMHTHTHARSGKHSRKNDSVEKRERSEKGREPIWNSIVNRISWGFVSGSGKNEHMRAHSLKRPYVLRRTKDICCVHDTQQPIAFCVCALFIRFSSFLLGFSSLFFSHRPEYHIRSHCACQALSRSLCALKAMDNFTNHKNIQQQQQAATAVVKRTRKRIKTKQPKQLTGNVYYFGKWKWTFFRV